jgi:1-acyl-sn-glycerol-3-phosphate acyltransferase
VGTREILPMDSLLVRGGRVRLRIGEPIPTSGLAIHDHRQLTQTLRERVLELTGQRD